MKRSIYTLMISTLLVMSCVEKEPKEKASPYPEPEADIAYILEGTVKSSGFTWTTNAVLGLYSSMQSVKASNLACKIHGWADTNAVDPETGDPIPYDHSPYEGRDTARFDTPKLNLVKGENKFLVYYPYKSDLVYIAGMIYGLAIDGEQVQTAPNVAARSFSMGTMTGIPGIDDTFKFALTPVSAVADIEIASDELSSYKVSKVTIAEENLSVNLSGAFNIKVATNEFTTLEAAPKAAVSIENPRALDSKQHFYINVLPVDLTGKKMIVCVEMVDDLGRRMSIPVLMNGVKFVAGTTTKISIASLKESDNAFSSWYCAREDRASAGLGYAFGQANTFLIQCKDGKTYSTGTYTPNASIPDEVSIDFRARGNFFYCMENLKFDPSKVTFDWARVGELDASDNGTGGMFLPKKNYADVDIDPSKFTYSVNGTNVIVKNTGAHAGAPILLMKQGNKIIWGWAFWNIAADGTQLKLIDYGGGNELLNMPIGQATTKYAQWASMEYKSGASASPITYPVSYSIYFYQWGRYLPVYHNYWPKMNYTDEDGVFHSGDVIAWYERNGSMTMEKALAHPAGFITWQVNGEPTYNWLSEETPYMDLWGSQTSAAGEDDSVKTVYDPCPEGYKVPSHYTINSIVEAAPSTTANKQPGWYGTYVNGTDEDHFFVASGRYTGAPNTTFLGFEGLNSSSPTLSFSWNSNYIKGSSFLGMGRFLRVKTDPAIEMGMMYKCGGCYVRCSKDNAYCR